MKQSDSASAQKQRTGAGDLSPMLNSLKDRANQAVKSAKDAVTNALQSIEGDDDDTGLPGQDTSGEKNIKHKNQSTEDKRRDEVDKDNNSNPKPTRHATENDPYSPPTFPPTLNDAIKEAQEDDSSGSNRRSQNSKSSKPGDSSSAIEQSKTKSKL